MKAGHLFIVSLFLLLVLFGCLQGPTGQAGAKPVAPSIDRIENFSTFTKLFIQNNDTDVNPIERFDVYHSTTSGGTFSILGCVCGSTSSCTPPAGLPQGMSCQSGVTSGGLFTFLHGYNPPPLFAGEPNYYKVSAVRSGDETISTTPALGVALNPPASLVKVNPLIETGNIEMEWVDASTPNWALVKYHVNRWDCSDSECKTASNKTEVGTPTETGFTDTILTPGNYYKYGVYAEYSNPTHGTAISIYQDNASNFLIAQAPISSSGIKIVSVSAGPTPGSNTSATVSWQTTTDDEVTPIDSNAILLYKLTTSGVFDKSVSYPAFDKSSYSVTLSHLASGTAYNYKIIACRQDTSQCTVFENWQFVTSGTAVNSPTSVSASAGDSKIDVNWTNPAQTATISKFNIYRGVWGGGYPVNYNYSNTIGTKNVVSGQSNYSWTDLSASNGTRYMYVITAATADGSESPDSKDTNGLPMPIVNDLRATAGSGGILLDWNRAAPYVPSSVGGWLDFNGYILYRSTDGTTYSALPYFSSYTKSGVTYYKTIRENTYTDNSSLVSGTKYYYKIRAVYHQNTNVFTWRYGQQSAPVNAVSTISSIAIPSVNRVENYDKFVKLFIRPPSDTTGIAKYNVYRSLSETTGFEQGFLGFVNASGSADVAFHDLNGGTFELPKLTNGKIVYYKVASDSGNGQTSALSTPAFKTAAMPTVNVLTDVNNSSNISLSWNAVSAPSGWTLENYFVRRWSIDALGNWTGGTIVGTVSGTVVQPSFADSTAQAGQLYGYGIKVGYYTGSGTSRFDVNASHYATVHGKLVQGPSCTLDSNVSGNSAVGPFDANIRAAFSSLPVGTTSGTISCYVGDSAQSVTLSDNRAWRVCSFAKTASTITATATATAGTATCTTSISDKTAYPAPSGVSAVGLDANVEISWNAIPSTDLGSVALNGFNIFRSTTSGWANDVNGTKVNSSQLSASTVLYYDAPVSNDTTYYYAVQVVYADENKVLSIEDSAYPSAEDASIYPYAQCGSSDIPSSMQAGQSYTVSITMENDGTEEWSGTDYKLAISGVATASTAVDSSESIAQGDLKTFS
ncbi:MAG: hypothetical protein V1847_04105, partial [Candidatus Diapherotrites archaeon]